MTTADRRTRRTLLLLLVGGTALWAAATVGHRSPRAAPPGETMDERVRAATRALPVGTTLDSARRYLRAHDLDFAQGRRPDALGGGIVLDVFVLDVDDGGPSRPATRVLLEFDARRRLSSARVQSVVSPGGRPLRATRDPSRR